MASVEVLAGPERRRRWSVEQKQAIVAAAFGPGAVVRDVARRADVNAEFDLPLASGSASRGEWLCSGAGGIGWRWCRRTGGAGDRDQIRGQRLCQDPGFGVACIGGRCRRGAGATMIPVPSGVRVWLAVGRTDMRKGMNGLALQVQQALGRDPHAGDLYVFRGARGDLLKIVWHDGIGMSLYAKRLERGRFIWPSPADGVVAISAAQLAYMLDGIDWRNPVFTWRPEVAG
jgi:transposase